MYATVSDMSAGVVRCLGEQTVAFARRLILPPEARLPGNYTMQGLAQVMNMSKNALRRKLREAAREFGCRRSIRAIVHHSHEYLGVEIGERLLEGLPNKTI
jgi:hypothetical protein